MKNLKSAYLAAILALAGAAHAEMDIAPPVKVTWNGFLHHWATVGENAKKEYVNSGTMLKRFRFRMGAEAYDGVTVVLVPELAGQQVTGGFGFTLLDAYAAVDLSKYNIDFVPPVTVTVGQFKTPFGLNRMYLPPQLALVEYSSVYNGGTGVMQTTSFWDNGVMLSYKPLPALKIDLAWVEGLGINQPTPGGTAFGARPNNDFVGKFDYMPAFVPGLTLGASGYYGEAYAASGTPGFPNKPKIFTGAHLKYAAFGKSFAMEAEFINRGVDRGALMLQLSQYLVDALQLVAGYDHMTDYRNDKVDATRYIGGLNWFPGGPVKVGVQQWGTAAGPSQAPVDSRTVVQTQVTW